MPIHPIHSTGPAWEDRSIPPQWPNCLIPFTKSSCEWMEAEEGQLGGGWGKGGGQLSDWPWHLWMTADELSLLRCSAVTAASWASLTGPRGGSVSKAGRKSQQGITGRSLKIHAFSFIYIFFHFILFFLQSSQAIIHRGWHWGESTENMTLISLRYHRYF